MDNVENNSNIMYALVSRGTSVLSECFTSESGNAAQVTRMLLNKIPQDESKMSYESNEFMVHYIVRNSITYLCVAGNHLKLELAFGFLDKIKEEFETRYQAYAHTLKAYSINEVFKNVLASKINEANEAGEGDHMEILKKKVRAIQDLAGTNLEKLIARDERIESISSKSCQLNEDAKEFEIGAHKLKRHFFWKNIKWLICMFTVLLVVIYLVISMMCGFDFKNCS